MSNKSENYNADSIQILEGLDPVRKRPGMYIGSVDVRGLHHLVWEIVDNSIDEALNGYGKKITIELNKDGSCTVSDDGRGMPIGQHKSGRSALEVIFTVLHAGGKFGQGGYKTSGGLHGVGASVVNALSEWLEVEVDVDKKKYSMRFERGKKVRELTEIGATNHTGSKVTFKPDPEIFLKVLEHFNFDSSEALVLEDSNNGILASHRANIPVICVPDLVENKPELLALTYKTLPSLLEVKDEIAKILEGSKC